MEEKVFKVMSTRAQVMLAAGLAETLISFGLDVDNEHLRDTPIRAAHALDELCCGLRIDPEKILSTSFPMEPGPREMISVSGIEFVSVCEHHLLPFHGTAHFSYIPNNQIVGLSKIPRLVEALARRPQTQENLTAQIVNIFQTELMPQGCAVMLRAYHSCMALRGVRQAGAYMTTTALRGIFMEKPEVKQEFLLGAQLQGVTK